MTSTEVATVRGYTAPPPTPTNKATSGELSTDISPNATTASTSVIASSSASPSIIMSMADLDALSQFLMQQSLHTPNLIALPSHTQRNRSPKPLISIEHVQIVNLNDYVDPTSKAALRWACEDTGVFYLTGLDGIFQPSHTLLEETEEQCRRLFVDVPVKESFYCLEAKQRPCCEANGLIASNDESDHHQHAFCFYDFDMEDTLSYLELDEIFRNTMTNFVEAITKLSKELLKILVEDLGIETKTTTKHHFLKPILCVSDGHQSNLSSKYIDDYVLSIQHFDHHQQSMSGSFLIAVGNQLQVWSEGRYKAPTIPSLSTNGINGLCIAFILIGNP